MQMKKYPALWPNMITAFALSCGLLAIFKTNMITPGSATYEDVILIVGILFSAAILDLLDGAVARAMKVETAFGGVFDSLADAVSFGVAPSVLIIKVVPVESHTPTHFFLMMGAFIYSISGVLRLVRYTVSSNEIQNDKEKIALAKSHFIGLPITAGAAITASTTLFLMSEDCQKFFHLSNQELSLFSIFTLFIVGYFMISRWKFISSKALRMHISSFQSVLVTAFIAALIFIGAIHHFPLLLFSFSWGYLIIAWILAIIRKIAGNRLKVLEDWDSEDET